MIKIRLEKWEKAVIFQVLEMDEEFRGVGDFFSHNNIILTSNEYIGITEEENIVCLRGFDREDDDDVEVRYFKTNRERDDYYNKVVDLFKAYNNREKEDAEEKTIFVLE